MSDPELEPLSAEVEELLKPRAAEVWSAGQKEALFHRIDGAVVAEGAFDQPDPPVSTPVSQAAPAQAAGALGVGKAVALVVASMVGGSVATIAAQKRFFPPAPVVVERVVVRTERVEVPVEVEKVAEVTPPPLLEKPTRRDAPPPPKAQPPSGGSSLELSRERQLIEGARTALLKGEPQRALSILEEHRAAFRKGQLAEEREGLIVQVLAQAGRREEARAALQRFKTAYPESIFVPALESLVE